MASKKEQENHAEELVSFKSPPVAEVILGVQFSGAITTEAQLLGEFWPRIRKGFPNLERGEPFDTLSEDFGPKQAGPRIEIRFSDGEPQRYLFSSADGRWLVQVQPERIAFNWRRIDPSDAYPRYKQVRRKFIALYQDFLATATSDLAEANPPDWCATTYSNHQVLARKGESELPGALSDILQFVKPAGRMLPPAEDTTLVQRHVLPPTVTGESQPSGRFYIQAGPGVRSTDDRQGYGLQLRAVARPDGPSRAAVIRRHDLSHNLIVGSFKEITTSKMHKLWGLEGGRT